LSGLGPHAAFKTPAIIHFIKYKWRQLVFIGYAQTFMYLVYLFSICISHSTWMIFFWFVIHLSIEIIQGLGVLQGSNYKEYFGFWNNCDLARLGLQIAFIFT